MSESQLDATAPAVSLEVAAAQDGFRADRALAALRPDLSRRTAKFLFHGSHVRLNGRRADGSERVRAGDRLTFPDPASIASGASLRRASGPRLVTRHGRQVARLYEDDYLLVISKPAEILIHPAPDGATKRETLADVFARAYPQAAARSRNEAPRARDLDEEEEAAPSSAERPAGGARRQDDGDTGAEAPPRAAVRSAPAAPEGIYFVHRLDMETTGCLLVAKAAGPRDALIRAFQERRVEKEYLAVVVGEVPWEKMVVKRPIAYRRGGEARPMRQRFTARGMPDWARIKKHGLLPRFVKKGVALPEGDPRGKPCETAFSVEERFRGYTVVRCQPRTGRLHQIRVHLAAEGFPLAYDPLYGRRSPLRLDEFCTSAARGAAGDEVVLNRLPLHARRLAFEHPVTGERVDVEAPLPGDLKEFLRVLRKFRRIAGGERA